MDSVENIVRRKRPKLGLETDYLNGRKAAINLMCLSCVGLNAQDGIQISLVEGCKSYACPLWRFRPGNGSINRPKNSVPNKDEYEKLISSSVSDAQKEHGRKLGLMRKSQANNEEV